MLFATDWSADGLPRAPFAAGVTLSGVHDLEPLVEARDVEDALHAVAPADQHHPTALLSRPRIGGDQRPQATRVHEIERPQVDHEQRGALRLDASELLLEPRGAGHVELAREVDLNPAGSVSGPDVQSCHERGAPVAPRSNDTPFSA